MTQVRTLALFVPALALGFAVAGCGGGAARIVARVRPVPTPSPAQCVLIARRYVGGNRSSAREMCKNASPHANWYRADISYSGGKSTWIACPVQGYDTRGRKLWKYPWGLTLTPESALPGESAVQMNPRSSISVTWFLIGHQAGPVARYKPTCRTEKFPPS
jgi:hypothetical protein